MQRFISEFKNKHKNSSLKCYLASGAYFSIVKSFIDKKICEINLPNTFFKNKNTFYQTNLKTLVFSMINFKFANEQFFWVRETLETYFLNRKNFI